MDGNIGKGFGTAIVMVCIFCVIVFWVGYELVDWLFIDDSIKVTEQIMPEIEIIVKDNVIDTLYIYRKP